MKKNSGKLLTLLLALLFAIGAGMPLWNTAALAEDGGEPAAPASMPGEKVGDPWHGVNFDTLLGGSFYFGTYEHELDSSTEATATPVLWRSMGDEDSEGLISALSAYVLDEEVFDKSQDSIYEDATIIDTLEDMADDIFEESDVEWSVVSDSTVYTQDGEIDYQPLYLPWGSGSNIYWTADDMDTDGKISTGQKKATLKDGASTPWWLRSESDDGDTVLYVTTSGSVNDAAPKTTYGIRPVVKIEPESILFFSEVVDDTDDQPWYTASSRRSRLTAYEEGTYSNPHYKLTLLSEDLDYTALQQDGTTVHSSDTLSVPVGGSLDLSATGTTWGTNLCYKIVNSSDVIVGYGEGGESSVTLDAADMSASSKDLPADTYTVYVWSQYDNDYSSHEGSTPHYFTLVVGSQTTYSVSAGTMEHGTVTASPSQAAAGATITVTPQPGDGYVLAADTLTYTVSGNDPVIIYQSGSTGKYEFTMPAHNVTLHAQFVAGSASSSSPASSTPSSSSSGSGSSSAPVTVKNGWQWEGEDWYYYASGIILRNSWVQDSGGWLYLKEDGRIAREAWKQDSRDWMYLGSDGHPVRDQWKRDSIDWCYLGSDTYLTRSGWASDSAGWCFLKADGRISRNGWAYDSRYTYYMGTSGYPVTGTVVIDGVSYTFDSSGRLL